MAQRAGADSSCSLGTVAPRRQRGGKPPARSWEGGFKKKSDRELRLKKTDRQTTETCREFILLDEMKSRKF